MNYGRYFRLNQALSKVVDGVAIYDYIDLPAYFGPSVDNPMSPKYPISVTVTSETVCFRLHYSAFKIEKKSLDKVNKLRLNENEKRRILGSDFPQYAYNEDDINNKTLPKINNEGLTDVGMAHMEEVILELPYTDNISSCLSDTIKDIYSSTFPQVVDENISMGGRFLEQLIRKRYPSKDFRTGENGIERHLYDELRKVMDDMVSYSRLWLMDLYKGGRVDLYKEIKDENSSKSKVIIIGFLRKLLLDFMFDLKHSDVFQNSANYQKMYSGLMSDFYFSALMHKCEYYYYRDLVTKEMAKEDGMTVDDKKRILTLYGDNLRKSEELWTQDIMNPASEKYFDYPFGDTHKVKTEEKKEEKESSQKTKSPKNIIDRSLVKIFVLEDNQLIKRNSWFAEPEEEMRRVCFPMDDEDDNNVKHICNVELMVNCLSVSNSKPLALIEYVNNNREKISRWFLRRYDFNDVCHLHLSRWANFVTFAFLLASLFIFVAFDFKKLTELDFGPDNVRIVYYLLSCLLLIAMFFGIKRRIAKKKNDLLHTYIKKNCERITVFTILLTILPIGLLLNDINIPLSNGYHVSFIIIAMLVVSLFFKSFRDRVVKPFLDWVGNSLEHITSYLHLLFPRLVASITTAWLTMSVGFDLYVAFFDRHVSRSTAGMILIIVFIFVMYELNRITPRSNIWKKLFRSVQLVTISYFISLVVGTVVINFLGQQYMDRGGAFDSMNKTTFTVDSLTAPIKGVVMFTVDSLTIPKKNVVMDRGGVFDSMNKTTFTVDSLRAPIKGLVNNVSFGDSKEEMEEQNKNIQQIFCEEKCQSIRIFHLGEHEIFFMRDFLIMFSFITMFMGIFLQMFIFEDKKMTEF